MEVESSVKGASIKNNKFGDNCTINADVNEYNITVLLPVMNDQERERILSELTQYPANVCLRSFQAEKTIVIQKHPGTHVIATENNMNNIIINAGGCKSEKSKCFLPFQPELFHVVLRNRLPHSNDLLHVLSWTDILDFYVVYLEDDVRNMSDDAMLFTFGNGKGFTILCQNITLGLLVFGYEMKPDQFQQVVGSIKHYCETIPNLAGFYGSPRLSDSISTSLDAIKSIQSYFPERNVDKLDVKLLCRWKSYFNKITLVTDDTIFLTVSEASQSAISLSFEDKTLEEAFDTKIELLYWCQSCEEYVTATYYPKAAKNHGGIKCDNAHCKQFL